jgi:hypothetical protein
MIEQSFSLLIVIECTGSSEIQDISSELLRSVVTKLHEYSADHEELHAPQFDELYDTTADISLRLEGCLAHLAALASSERQVSPDSHNRGRKVIEGAALGGIGAEVLTRARSQYREYRDDSRSKSSSRHSHKELKTTIGLAAAGLAAAAAAKYVSNYKANNEEICRGRSRTRSLSRRRSYDDDYDDYDDRRARTRSRSRSPSLNDLSLASAPTVESHAQSHARHNQMTILQDKNDSIWGQIGWESNLEATQAYRRLAYRTYSNNRPVDNEELRVGVSGERNRYYAEASSSPEPSSPQLSLPFIGYTFKRFNNFQGQEDAHIQISEPSRDAEPAIEPKLPSLPLDPNSVNELIDEVSETKLQWGLSEDNAKKKTGKLISAQYNTVHLEKTRSLPASSLSELAGSNRSGVKGFRQQILPQSNGPKVSFKNSLPTAASTSKNIAASLEEERGAIEGSKALHSYQEQLLATVPGYTPNQMSPGTHPQPIELSAAQIEQQGQAAREYKLSLMPSHDSDSKESEDAHSHALQDYQMSLKMGYRGKHGTRSICGTRRFETRRVSDETGNNKVKSRPISNAPILAPPGMIQDFDFDTFFHDCTQSNSAVISDFTDYTPGRTNTEHVGVEGTGDVLQEFDFDSFLQESSHTTHPFEFDTEDIACGVEENEKPSTGKVAENNDDSNAAMDSLLDKLRAAAPQARDQRDCRRRARLQDRGLIYVASGQQIPDSDQIPDAEAAQSEAISREEEEEPENLASPDIKVPENAAGDADVLFINAKQFHRILKRRFARQQFADLEQQQQAQRRQSTPSENAVSPDPTYHAEVDDAACSPVAQTTVLSQPTNTNADSDLEDDQIELAWSYPALSTTQTSRLWWQAYLSLISSSSSKSPIFTTISNAFESELGVSASRHLSDGLICRRIANRVHELDTAIHNDKSDLAGVLEARGDILKVLITIEEQLGFEIATLGWNCVTVLLSVGLPLVFIFFMSS